MGLKYRATEFSPPAVQKAALICRGSSLSLVKKTNILKGTLSADAIILTNKQGHAQCAPTETFQSQACVGM